MTRYETTMIIPLYYLLSIFCYFFFKLINLPDIKWKVQIQDFYNLATFTKLNHFNPG